MKRFIKLIDTPFLLLWAAAAAIFTFGTKQEYLRDWDECVYAQNVREMYTSGHHISNIWNGYIDLQKPPLYSWTLGAWSRLFGDADATLRMLNVTCALILLALVYAFSVRYFNRLIGFLAAAILLSAEVFVITAGKINTDVFFSTFIFLGSWLFIEFMMNKKASKLLPLLAGLSYGLATMSKGLGSLQFAAALGLIFLLYPSRRLFTAALQMGVSAAVVIIPWHAVTYARYGQRFIQIYFIESILRRSSHPIEFHRERWWFYLDLMYRELMPILAVAIVFPTVFLITSLEKLWKKGVRGDVKKMLHTIHKYLVQQQVIVSVFVLTVIPLILLTRVQTRLPWYALPFYPFLSIYLAYNIGLIVEMTNKWLGQNKITKRFARHIGLLVATLFILFVLKEAALPMLNEARITASPVPISLRRQAEFAVAQTPGKTLHHLVPLGERLGREVLPPEEQLDMTWVFGGNPCMVYYGGKQTNYYYTTQEFEQALQSKKGLFLIENGDHQYDDGTTPIYKNSEYTLFRK